MSGDGRAICSDLLGLRKIGFVCLDLTPAMQSDLREMIDYSRIGTGASVMTESGAAADVDRGENVKSKTEHVNCEGCEAQASAQKEHALRVSRPQF